MGSYKGEFLFAFSLLVAASLFHLSQGAGIAVYWGQNELEGSLKDACDTGNYQFVIIAFITHIGNGQTPVFDLSDHCAPIYPITCNYLNTQIKGCQSQGIKVLLSVGGGQDTNIVIASKEDAKQVAKYLWDNFLGGESSSRPFGDAVLDGIDFDMKRGSNQHLDDLARELTSFQKKVYLSAAPKCPIPDYYLDTPIKTGLFDYVWVLFFHNFECDYTSGFENFINTWNQWTSSINSSQIFLGLPASPEAAVGYIPPDELIYEVIPAIKRSPNYGGVLLFNRYEDQKQNPSYSSLIKGSLTTPEPSIIKLVSSN